MDERMKELERRAKAFKCYLLTNHPFWGTIAANLKFVVDKNFPGVAGTDCSYEVLIGLECEKLSHEEFKFVMMHELLHVVFFHSQRQGKRNPYLWNIACDYTVNSILIDEMKLPMPKTIPGLYDERFSLKSAEEIYATLYREIRDNAQPIYIVCSGETGSSCIIEVSITGAREITDEAEKEKILNNPKAKKIDARITSDLKKSKKESIEEQIARIKDIIAQAHIIHMKHGDRHRGTLPASVMRHIKRIIEPEIPFDRLLARYASEMISGKSEYSYTPIHKRHYLEFDAVMPTISKEEVPKVVIAVDTSASITEEELEVFAGAIKKISTLTPEVTVITCDCAVHQVVKPGELEDFLKSLKMKGDGGTSHIPVFKYIDEKIKNPDVVMCLTDGYSEYPEKKPRYPVIWILTPEHQTPPWGHKIVISKKREIEI